MHKLLFDIGHSSIKYANTDASIKGIKRKDYKRIEYNSHNYTNIFKKILRENHKPEEIWISSTNSRFTNFIKNKIIPKYPGSIKFITQDLNLPIKIRYKSILGSDRIASLSAANYLFPDHKYKLIIDFGTATTYSALVNGCFTGGIISPGIFLGFQALSKFTTLPETDKNILKKLINDNTKDSIKSGVFLYSIYSSEKIIECYKKKYNNILVIATGNILKKFRFHFSQIDIIDYNLVLKGIKIISYMNQKC